MELSLSGLEPVFPVTLPLSDRSSCCGFLGKWHRVGKPTILSQGGLQSGGARQSYVQIQAPALIIPMTLGKRVMNLFKTQSPHRWSGSTNNHNACLVPLPCRLRWCTKQDGHCAWHLCSRWLIIVRFFLFKTGFHCISPALKALQCIWELRRSQTSKSVSVKCLLTWMQFCVCVYTAFSQKYDFSITQKPPYAWGLVLR